MTMTPEDRARRAAELLADPLIVEMIEKAKATAVREWEAAGNPLDREYCHAAYRAVSKLTRALLNEVEKASLVELRAGQKGTFYNLFQRLKEIF